jgi:hypothetical protein
MSQISIATAAAAVSRDCSTTVGRGYGTRPEDWLNPSNKDFRLTRSLTVRKWVGLRIRHQSAPSRWMGGMS